VIAKRRCVGLRNGCRLGSKIRSHPALRIHGHICWRVVTAAVRYSSSSLQHRPPGENTIRTCSCTLQHSCARGIAVSRYVTSAFRSVLFADCNGVYVTRRVDARALLPPAEAGTSSTAPASPLPCVSFPAPAAAARSSGFVATW
jgi:hypothetical protein